MDVGRVNDSYFFSNMGIGIDAQIIKRYERLGYRKLSAYLRAAVSASVNYKPMQTMFKSPTQLKAVNPYLLFVSNSNEMGYAMSLTPDASLFDGMLDVVLIEKLPFWRQLILGYRILRNQVKKFSNAEHSQVKWLEISLPEAKVIDAQIDGEFRRFQTNVLEISVLEKALNVVTA